MRKPTGLCAVCLVYKGLTESGTIKPHKRHEVTCEGSLQSPKKPAPKRTDAWNAARRATIERDGAQCRKCLARDGLEVHHILERVNGGKDELENLITLCSDCHAEWTFCQPPGLTFERWRQLPPARMLTVWFSLDWPSDINAAEFKDQFITGLALLLYDKANPRWLQELFGLYARDVSWWTAEQRKQLEDRVAAIRRTLAAL